MRRRNLNQFSGSIRLFRVFSVFRLGVQKNRNANLFFHCFGLSALGASLFLQGSVMSGFLEYGYFKGIEPNVAVVYFEVFLTLFAVVYLGYLLWRFILSAAKL